MTKTPLLLTPGPLTTTARTKQAMLTDWGSWDVDFNHLTARVCEQVTMIAGAEADYVTVPLQGSGTFAVEAAINTLVPRHGKFLVLNNGAYGARMARLCRQMGLTVEELLVQETEPTDPAILAERLAADPAISHVGVIHCETGTGLLNPLEELGAVIEKAGRRMILDAMSTFGALPIDVAKLPCDALISSANKCLEGVPGFSFIVADKQALRDAEGRCTSLSLDLTDQWLYMQKTGRWRFTPPTHVVAAFHEALAQFDEQGGRPARLARYTQNWQVLVDGMAALGITTLLPRAHQAPIIVTFVAPDQGYDFQSLYDRLKARGFIIYPGKTTDAETFRIGCIGAITPEDMARLIDTIGEEFGHAQ